MSAVDRTFLYPIDGKMTRVQLTDSEEKRPAAREFRQKCRMAVADARAWLRKRHAACSDRIAELKALPMRTEEQKYRLNAAIEACQFFEKELETLKG